MTTQEERLTLKVPEQLYVGCEGRKPFSTETYPLGFATPYGADKDFAKRKSTVDNWVGPRYTSNGYEYNIIDGKYEYRRGEDGKPIMKPQTDHGAYEAQVIDNVLLEGFTFEESVTRWQTSNKWFTINDPRGFSLQISAENLGDIILNCTISNGLLQGKFLWARARSNVWLCRENHPSYVELQNPVVTRTELVVGDKLKIGQAEGVCTYLGKFYSLRMTNVGRYIRKVDGEIMQSGFSPSYNYGWGYDRSQDSDNYRRGYYSIHKTDMTPVYAFREADGYLRLYRSKPKTYRIVETGADFEALPLGTALDIWTQLPISGKALLFNSKKELADFDTESFDFVSAINVGRGQYAVISHLGEHQDGDSEW